MTETTDSAPPKFLVRHGAMRFIGEFAAAHPVRRADTVIVRTERGQEVGEVLCPSTPEAVSVIPEPTRGDVVRVATADDRSKMVHLKAIEQKEFAEIGRAHV